MSSGLLGHKVGMMRVFTDEGESIPVTVIDVSNNRITQIKNTNSDGYDAIQIAFGNGRVKKTQKGNRLRNTMTAPLIGHFKKAAVEPGKLLKEFRINSEESEKFTVGSKLDVEMFKVGQFVDVQGTSIGKGYAGTIKRYNFASGRASHGNSRAHNVPGSIGMCEYPGRVFPGKRMTGHMGDVKKTVQNLKIIRMDAERQLLFVKGGVPGCDGGVLVVKPAIKKAKANAQVANAMVGDKHAA